MKFKNTFNKIKWSAKKHSPEILVVSGIAGMVTAAVLACKSTLKLNYIFEEASEQLYTANDALDRIENGEEIKCKDGSLYTAEDAIKDLKTIKVQTGLRVAKLYAPSIILGTMSIVSILSGHHILRKRNIAISAAYAAIDKGFKEYRQRVVEQFGEKTDYNILHGIKEVEVEETVTDENGKEKTVKKTVEVFDGVHSPYSRVFDELNPNFDFDSREANVYFVKTVERFMNQKLMAEGRLFLNDVYRALGMEETKAGQVVGWIYDPENEECDSFVSFGISDADLYKLPKDVAERRLDFLNGFEPAIMLDFNVQGNIMSDISREI